MLEALTYYNAKNQLCYNEAASKAINSLILPAYRQQLAKGNWKLTSERSVEGLAIGIAVHVFDIHAAATKPAVASQEIPAISAEELHAAKLFLAVCDYCAGRNLDLGRAVLLVHTRSL